MSDEKKQPYVGPADRVSAATLTAAHSIYSQYEPPQLSVLDYLVQAFKQLQQSGINLERVAVVGMQHLLETTASMLKSIVAIGVNPRHILIAGKCYSTNTVIEHYLRERLGLVIAKMKSPRQPGGYTDAVEEVQADLWQRFAYIADNIDIVIVLDDGFRTFEHMPATMRLKKRVAIVEQTRGGLYSSALEYSLAPVIEVASSAAKKVLESPFIAAAVVRQVEKVIIKFDLAKDKDKAFGVIGNGAIGRAVVNRLLQSGFTVVVYDKDETVYQSIQNENFIRVDSIEAVFFNATCILGCSGLDVTEGINFAQFEKDLYFMSCTSEDKECKSLLKQVASTTRVDLDTLRDIRYHHRDQYVITIVGGGFPINFDRAIGNVPAADIALTQGLMFSAFLQALFAARKPIADGHTVNKAQRQSLDPYLQRCVVETWIKSQPPDRYSDELKQHFNDIIWITSQSGGKHFPNETLKRIAELNSPVAGNGPGGPKMQSKL